MNTNTYINHLTISEDAVHMPGGGGGAELAGFENGNPPQIGMPWAGWGGGGCGPVYQSCLHGGTYTILM